MWRYLPSSPPAIEKSRGSIVHFCISWARDTALRLAASMPDCMNCVTAAPCSTDVRSFTSDTSMPAALKLSLAKRVSFDVGAVVWSSTSVCMTKFHKYACQPNDVQQAVFHILCHKPLNVLSIYGTACLPIVIALPLCLHWRIPWKLLICNH